MASHNRAYLITTKLEIYIRPFIISFRNFEFLTKDHESSISIYDT